MFFFLFSSIESFILCFLVYSNLFFSGRQRPGDGPAGLQPVPRHPAAVRLLLPHGLRRLGRGPPDGGERHLAGVYCVPFVLLTNQWAKILCHFEH